MALWRRCGFHMRVICIAIITLFPIFVLKPVMASSRQSITMETAAGPVLIEKLASHMHGPRSAVLVLSGSKGFGSPVYNEIGITFNKAGLDVYFIHVLNSADLSMIGSAANAQIRIRYYKKRMPDWDAKVRAVSASLHNEPQYGGRIGMIGISLGAQIAGLSADKASIKALVLVDGAYSDDSHPQHQLPPLMLIWGREDRVFPLSAGQSLLSKALTLGGEAQLDVYSGGAHDFFLRQETQLAQEAHHNAAEFFVKQLSK